jgi:hypothetical protein
MLCRFDLDWFCFPGVFNNIVIYSITIGYELNLIWIINLT